MPTDVTGIKSKIYSHPFGDTYERSMNGVSDVILYHEVWEKIVDQPWSMTGEKISYSNSEEYIR